MFQCGVCHKQSEPTEKATRVVLQTREIQYPFRSGAHKFKDKTGTKVAKDDPGGTGTAIVKEVLAHFKCVPAPAPEVEEEPC